MTEIVNLKQTVEYGTVITDDMLTVAEVGSYGLPDNVVRDKSEITGLVAGDTIYAGEYLWRDRFMTEKAYKDAASKNSLGLSDGTYLLTIALQIRSVCGRAISWTFTDIRTAAELLPSTRRSPA